MESKVQKMKKSTDVAEENDGVLWIILLRRLQR